MKKGCGSASLWGNGYRGRRPETGISRNSELRRLGKCALFSWLAPPKAGGELALAPERGNRWKEGGPSPSLRDTSPPCGSQKSRRACADPRDFRPLRKFRLRFLCHRQREAGIPRRGERQVRKAAILRARGRLRAAVSPSHRRTPSVTATSRRDSSPGGGARGSPCGQSRPCAQIRSSPRRSIPSSLSAMPSLLRERRHSGAAPGSVRRWGRRSGSASR